MCSVYMLSSLVKILHVTSWIKLEDIISIVTGPFCPSTRIYLILSSYIILGEGRGEHLENIWWKYFVNMLWTCCEHVVNMLLTCCEHVVNMLWTCCEHVINMWWTCVEHVVNIWWTCGEHVVNMWWTCWGEERGALRVDNLLNTFLGD